MHHFLNNAQVHTCKISGESPRQISIPESLWYSDSYFNFCLDDDLLPLMQANETDKVLERAKMHPAVTKSCYGACK